MYQLFDNYLRINKTKAIRLLNEGYTVRIAPCKINIDNSFNYNYGMVDINLDELISHVSFTTIDNFLNEYEYYNCNYETGKYISFYIKQDYIEKK